MSSQDSSVIQPKKKSSKKNKAALDVKTDARENNNFILEIENYDMSSGRTNDVQEESKEE